MDVPFSVKPTYIVIPERDPEKTYAAVRDKNSYLLESSDGGEKIARYSFIGFNPILKVSFKNGEFNLNIQNMDYFPITLKGDNPIDAVKNILEQFSRIQADAARFFGGFVGYFSYDIIRYQHKLGENNVDDLKHPDCEFLLAKNNIIFDHKAEKTYLISHSLTKDVDIKQEKNKLNEIKEKISQYDPQEDKTREGKRKKYSSNMKKEEYIQGVKEIKKHIKEGDIFQAVLSQRLKTRYSGDKFEVYRMLKKINPSPYMYYLDYGSRKIVGASPEMLVRVEDRRVETYPIAGTRPRGINAIEDNRLGQELLADEKEKAEHVMLVDLGRNDLGRVCRYGSVKVNRFMKIEKYSHVQHIISEVSGMLDKKQDLFSALKSVFPAGTVSGAPKVRAMEIIDELEPTRRGIYAGCVGYFSFNQNMDSAITIRTIDFEGEDAFVQVGAGIVADSDPESEYQETLRKGEAMLEALGVGG
ncbi:MAG: anthranilate synthase component I [Candidatus Altiarchaeales archaeon ex4484_96]|nr:MAG: anthranilate synthase component I [Candidatus Altiarchaeales archaeon ex4484_96]